MAHLIKSDGTETIILPKGKKWSLLELQTFVGGDIEQMPGMPKSVRILMNEEGALKGLPFNQRATNIVMGFLQGKVLRYEPKIHGDVLILDKTEKW